MKIAWFLAGVFAWGILNLRAEDWTTTDGTVYRNVTVLSHDEGFVTIMYADGGARIELAKLDPDLQKQFGYDPAKAQALVAAKEAAEKKEREAQLAQEYSAVPATPALAPAPPLATTVPPAQPAPAPVAAATSPAQVKPAAKPPVDTFAIEQKIHDDQEQLDGLQDDIRAAQHQVGEYYAWYNGYGVHYDNTGSAHPNAIGESPRDVLDRLLKKQADLQADLADLQSQLKLAEGNNSGQ